MNTNANSPPIASSYVPETIPVKQSTPSACNTNTNNATTKFPFQSKYYDNPLSKSSPSPSKQWHPFEAPQSPILGNQSDIFEDENWCANPIESSSKHPEPRYEEKDFQIPDGHVMLKYQTSIPGDIRQQLLVQRTFNALDDHQEPKTSSPMRKVRVCMTNSSLSTVTVSPSSGTMHLQGHNFDSGDTCFTQHKPPYMSSPFRSPSSRAPFGTHDIQTVFKTPNRHQRNEDMFLATPSRSATPQRLSPASTASYSFTPGRQFVNPFEIDHDRLHMPIFSPNLFKVTSSASKEPNQSEAFWSVEHTAALMPVDIKEAEIRRQHLYQQKLDRDHDAKIQTAINKFFSNEVIVPSPWSQKESHALPRTPGSTKTVSCQTLMSVPPKVDLIAELEGKYQLPASRTDSSSSSDLMVNSFIRRKLLNQLNDNDSSQSSPVVPSRQAEDVSNSPSPAKQMTPEWEKEASSNINSGHFSSSPIEQSPHSRGNHLALSETDLLASPELFPAGSGTSQAFRTSDMFFPRQDVDHARTVMQLDFSSILDDPDDSEDDARETAGTMVQKGFSETHLMAEASGYNNEAMSFATSQDSDPISNRSGGFSRKSFLTSVTSTESTNDVASAPQTSSSQDTGYQTASLQSTHHECGSNSNLACLDSLPSAPFHGLDKGEVCSANSFTAETPREHFLGFNQKTNTSQEIDGSFLSHWSSQEKSSSVDDIVLLRKNEPCRIRKVRTLADIRQSKVSRDLTRSFNEEVEKNRNSFSPTVLQDKVIEMADKKCKLNDTSRSSLFATKEDSLDISMRSMSPYFNSSSDRPGPSLVETNALGFEDKQFLDHSTPCKQKIRKYSKQHDDTLQAARLLLERSVEMPERFTIEETLRPDYFSLFQDIENQDPQMSGIARSETSSLTSDLSNTSTPTSRIFNSIEKKINQVEGSKLGSEIAAEIIKRAENDLAKLTDLMGKSSPRT
ncbi:uncharacterized protein LOC106060926 [Biomphalaria glabrata]|uniref:Protein aurora borealis n=1 Tax=Biomphalaria glabrata TaxID=6526 RepID=A0A9W3BML2_BIOGL|nr:uncharacterized protein LOC106060926 [Biomphalaria glabrata]XP_055900664.1 uncharacterized protein LOC106060926 [Biomphalaria glabrata]XP_055900665.1 uncharacterized protein LOC106060926 [Biomphalaria glabrata]